MADFLLTARRTLEPEEYRIFKFHHLLAADWRLCATQLKMDKGVLFHLIYRIEQRMGRVFREMEPYGLFPLDEYFNGVVMDVTPVTVVPEGPRPIRPPMARVKRPEMPLAA